MGLSELKTFNPKKIIELKMDPFKKSAFRDDWRQLQ